MPNVDIPENDARVQYTASAGQTVFVYDFILFDEDDVVVIREGTVLTLGNGDYSVTGVGVETGGTVVLASGATAGDLVTLYRRSAIRRDSQYQSDGKFDAPPFERDFDKITTILQDQRRDVARALTLDPEDTITSIALPVAEPNKLLAWNDDGTGFANTSYADISTSINTVLSNLASGDILTYNGTNWVNGDLTAGNAIFDPSGLTYTNATDVQEAIEDHDAAIGLAGSLKLLGSYTASDATSIDIGDGLDLDAVIDGTYDVYVLEFVNILPATDDSVLLFRVSDDGGSTFEDGSVYYFVQNGLISDGTEVRDAGTGVTAIKIASDTTGDGIDSNITLGGLNGIMRIYNPASTSAPCCVSGVFGYRTGSSSNVVTETVYGFYTAVDAVDAFRLLMDSGNIASGTVYLYGVRKS